MIINIISRTRVPHLPYTLYREGQASGRVNKEAVCRSTKRPHEGKARVSVKPTKVTEPHNDLLERVNRERQRYQCFWQPAEGIERQLSILERKVLNNRICVTVSEKTQNIEYSMKFSYNFEQLYHRANLPPSLRLIVRFALELECFVHNRAPPTKIEK